MKITTHIDEAMDEKIEAMIASIRRKQTLELTRSSIVRMALTRLLEQEDRITIGESIKAMREVK